MRTNGFQLILGIILSFLFTPAAQFLIDLASDYDIPYLDIMFGLIIIFQVIFYFITTRTTILWTIISFGVNYIIWITELVQSYKFYEYQELLRYDLFEYFIPIIAGILWTLNKLILDIVLCRFPKIEFNPSRIEKLIKKTAPNSGYS